MKSIKLDTTVPVDPSLQPIGDPFYSGHGDDYWYLGPDAEEWEKQVPTRTCSSGWVFGSQGSDWKTPAICYGQDSFQDENLCGEGYVPYKTVVKRVLCGIHDNSGSLCNKWSGWPDANVPDSYKSFNLVTDNTLYCEESLQPSPEEITPLQPSQEETPVTPLQPSQEETLEEELETYWDKYWLWISIFGGVIGFLLLVIFIIILKKIF